MCARAAWLEFVSWTDSHSDSSCAATGLVTLGQSLLCLSLSTCRTGLTESTSGLSSGLNETICIKKAEQETVLDASILALSPSSVASPAVPITHYWANTSLALTPRQALNQMLWFNHTSPHRSLLLLQIGVLG